MTSGCRTDVGFVYTPSQLALSALEFAITQPTFSKEMTSIIKRVIQRLCFAECEETQQTTSEGAVVRGNDLMRILEDIQHAVSKGRELDEAGMMTKAIDLKLRECRSPLMDTTSKVYVTCLVWW